MSEQARFGPCLRAAAQAGVVAATAFTGAFLACDDLAAAGDDAAELALGKALFTKEATPPCAACHTLKDAGSAGAVGPVLDELQPDAARVATALKGGVGMMPSYQAVLSEAQINALAR